MEYSQEQEQSIERINIIGEEMEKRIGEGREVFLEEEDRLYLKKIVEKFGRNLETIEGKANLSEQAEGVIGAYQMIGGEKRRNQGCDAALTIVNSVVFNTLESISGNVFKNEEVDKEKVSEFIENFFEAHYEKEIKFVPDQYEKGSWQRNTMYRIEAVMAATNKILWILAANDEEEGKRRQNTPGVLKHLRERVMRGLEKEGQVIPEGIQRVDREEIIRHLPKIGVQWILDTICQL